MGYVRRCTGSGYRDSGSETVVLVHTATDGRTAAVNDRLRVTTGQCTSKQAGALSESTAYGWAISCYLLYVVTRAAEEQCRVSHSMMSRDQFRLFKLKIGIY